MNGGIIDDDQLVVGSAVVRDVGDTAFGKPVMQNELIRAIATMAMVARA